MIEMVSALSPDTEVHVLYGTQTGNAEEIARRIAAELMAAGRNTQPARSLADYAVVPAFGEKSLPSTLVIVVSTTGDGDPPDAIRPFMRFIRKASKNSSSLCHVSYALLGLGDTNYENFCNTAKRIDVALIGAGARAFTPRGLADDGTGLDAVVEPWIARMYAALDAHLGQASSLECANNASESKQVGGESSTEDEMNDRKAKNMSELSTTNSRDSGIAPSNLQSDMEALVNAIALTELGFEEKDLPKLVPPSLRLEALDGDELQERPSVQSDVSLSPFFEPSIAIKADVVGAKRMTSWNAVKAVYHIEVDCFHGETKLDYAPGDAFGVLVGNLDNEVDRLLAITGIDPDGVFNVQKPDAESSGHISVACGTARNLLKYRVDFRAVPKKGLLRALSEYCHENAEKKLLLLLSSKQGRKEYTAKVLDIGLGTLDLLERLAPSCRPSLALLLDLLPPLSPRYYSAASAPEVDGSCLHFAFSVVRNGLATTHLSLCCERFMDSAKGNTVPQVVIVPRSAEKTSAFKPPPKLETPYLMIGPGTGVAPFRGFLRQRQFLLQCEENSQVKGGNTMLFFGCRNRTQDFLYSDDLQEFESQGTLSVLDVAFSRENESVVYVQDRLLERASDVSAALLQGAMIYVCGDGGGMATGVDTALREIVTQLICAGDTADAALYMKRLASDRRYLRDIWYFGSLDDE